MQILYIEDDSALARLVQRRLQRESEFTVRTAADGTSGLQSIAANTPDAVIIDYILPDMNGLDVLKSIDAEYPAIVTIMVTGAGDEAVAVHAMKYHARDYIVKDTAGKYLDALPKLIAQLIEHQHLISRQQESDREIRSLSAAVSQSGDAILIFNTDGAVTYANDAFERMTGYLAKDIIGSNPTMDQQQAWPLTHALWGRVTSAETFESKLTERRRDGSFFPAIVNISPILDGQGNVERHLACLKDMSDYETLLAEFNQAQKMEAVGTLVAGIAHDFNNTLAAISGNLYLAKNHAAAIPDVVRKITAVEGLCSHAASMIQQLLTFARKSMTDMKAVEISSFVKEAVKIQQVSIPENIVFECDFGTSDLYIRGDISLLQQVIMNLLNNARDAVQDAANPCISIRLEPYRVGSKPPHQHTDLAAGNYVCITIADNGSGIDKHVMEHIFEPFFTTKAVDKGTGLGLAMAYGAIQSHGGVIQVNSRVGKGAAFKMYLPLIELPHHQSDQQSPQQIAKGHGETILLADDNNAIIKAGTAVLESLGYKVLTAMDGDEAVEVYRSHKDVIALAILDIVMPKLGGVEAAQLICSFHPDAKIIFSTGYDRENLLRQSTQLDAASILKKPFTVQELSQVIRLGIDT